jgi:hypothetical protein
MKMDTLCNLVSKFDTAPQIPEDPTRTEQADDDKVPVEPKGTEVEPKEAIKAAADVWENITLPTQFDKGILAIDFGTSLSKASLKTSASNLSVPVPLAEVASKELYNAGIEIVVGVNYFVEDSVVYIDDDNNVLCGSLARKKYLDNINSGSSRPAIQNLKQFLIGGGTSVSLQKSYFPSDEKLNIQEVLATFLAYLFYLTKVYAGKKKEIKVDLDAMLRNFSIPVWEDKKYRNEVKGIMQNAISSAYCLEKWFKKDLLFGIPIARLRDAFNRIKDIDFNFEGLIGAEVTEPVAAGFSRIYELDVKPGNPSYLFIIDVGAGSTDFALLTISQPVNSNEIKIFTSRQGGVGKGVSVWDNALRAIIFSKVKETFGLTESQPEYQILRAKLDAQIRLLKENVLAATDGYPIDISPVNTTPLLIKREDVENSIPVKDAISAINQGFNQYIDNVLISITKDKFHPQQTEFLITGGGSFIASVVDCIRECVSRFGPSYPRKVVNNYLPGSYRNIPNFMNLYPMLAVSLGSTESSYPEEKMMPSITPDPGSHVVGGYYQKGV